MSKLSADQKSDIQKWLYTRLEEIIIWYEGCDAVDETLQNAKRDVDSVLREMVVKFKLKPVPFYPSLTFDMNNKIVVKFVNREFN